MSRELLDTEYYAAHWEEARFAATLNGLQVIEHGWEQHVIINEPQGLVYRYPRHASAAEKLEDEVNVLADINSQEWPISFPILVSHNSVFSTYEYVPGSPLTTDTVASLTEHELERIGHELGQAMSMFHQLESGVVEQKRTKHDTTLLEYYAQKINSCKGHPLYERAEEAFRRLAGFEGTSEPVVVHGDLHGPNVIIDPDSKRLAGIIDISEMEIGDPHQEFRKVFMTFPDALDSMIASYQASGGQPIDAERVIAWAYVNEWANLFYLADRPDNLTYQRAYSHLLKWGQI